MTRNEYLRELIRLYLAAPQTPPAPRRRDWAIAADLYRHRVPLEDLAHAMRLVTLRRQSHTAAPTIHSLAYYRAAHRALTPEELDPQYVRYVELRYQARYLKDSETAAVKPESRAF